jgi:hypothetical protein
MTEPLQFLWPGIEAVNPVFARAAIIRWPKGVHEQLVAAGLVIPQGTSTRIRCPECGETHVGTPFQREQPDGTMRAFIHCRRHVRAQVTDRDLQQWAASVESLVGALSTSLSLGGKATKLDSDRVWRCGRWVYQGVQRDVLFARGLRRHDGVQFRRAITAAHRPVVFVGSEIPDADFWQGRIPPLIRLREVATLVDAKIEIDVTQVIGLVRSADDSGDGETITLDQLKLMIRQQVKAEGKTALTDDILIEAYRQCGTVRDAAAFLTEQSGQTVSKDKVQRAVTRGGGPEVVMRSEDSESVVRTVSSRRRDTPIEKRDSSK